MTGKGLTLLKQIGLFLLGIFVLLALYASSLYSYLLFHSLVEMFAIVVACSVFMLAWNARHFLDNNYLLFIGIAYLFVAGLDLFHTLAYKGMGVFATGEANLPTQLWIAARYLQSISLLMAPFFLSRQLRPHLILVIYAGVVSIILLSIYAQVFPDCYLEGIGLTPFKKISEYVISVLLVVSIAVLWRHRQHFDRTVLKLMTWSIVFTIGAELAFTFYVGVYDLSNLIGHIFKIIAFYLTYKAIVESGLVKPYSVLFRDLKQREEKLQQYTLELQARNADLDAFAHTVAHDLKIPLASIIICNDLLQEGRLDEEQQELLLGIKETAFKMNSIIDELLLLSEIRKAEVNPKPLEMAIIVKAAHKRLAHMLQTYQGDFALPDTWPVALGYGPWVEEVWVNYINNALKYGGNPPRIELGADSMPNNQIRFWVRDHGPGLDPEAQKQAFNRFTRLSQVHVTGHGLGLSIVKRIVHKLNGQVGVESSGIKGEGCLFFFTLPAGPAN